MKIPLTHEKKTKNDRESERERESEWFIEELFERQRYGETSLEERERERQRQRQRQRDRERQRERQRERENGLLKSCFKGNVMAKQV